MNNYNIVNDKQTGDQLTAQEWNELANAVIHLLENSPSVDTTNDVLVAPDETKYILTRWQEETHVFGNININLSYQNIPNTGGSRMPSLSYSQVETITHSDGTQETVTHTSGAVVSYSLETELEDASINESTGEVTYDLPNSNESIKTIGTVTVTVTMNDVTDTKTAVVKQAAAAESNILIYGQIDISESNITDILGGEASIDSFIQASAISDFQELPDYNVDDNNPADNSNVYSQTISRNSTGYCIMVYMLSNTNHNVVWFSELENSKFPIVQLSDYYSDYPSTCQYLNQNYSYDNKSYKLVAFVTNSDEDKNYKIQIQDS